MTAPIHSPRLDLIPMTPSFLRASLRCDLPQAERELKASVPPEWPGELADVLSLRLRQLDDEPALQQWLARAMVHRGAGIMIGHIGFHTAPGAEYLRPFSPGGVELGFTVFPSFRQQGYAREACIALMRWARGVHDVGSFVVSIRPDNVPSQALAAQLGFVRVGSHIDEVDGLEEVLEYRVLSDGPSA
jgi:ribosomal-protein-alanine N-acetyltransferase